MENIFQKKGESSSLIISEIIHSTKDFFWIFLWNEVVT